MERLSSGQLAILEEFKKVPVIAKELPDYWNPKPLGNTQIDRLAARGFVKKQPMNSLFAITAKGAARIGYDLCKCGGATHPEEAACVHCGVTKSWAQPSPNLDGGE